ncbi:GD17818 [Drosophila simulans]|uniref:GD17818 n=1 Tax=Drosophila simulans TaxID=7240 RepID=B4Q881_DROSI|nr:GD17818 [Drosophila simulans]
MNTIRPCCCKGVRTCLSCEQDFQDAKTTLLYPGRSADFKRRKQRHMCNGASKTFPCFV